MNAMSEDATLPCCDCLDWCGDDERIDQLGRAERDRVKPCPQLVAERVRRQRHRQAAELLAGLEGADLLDKLTRLVQRANVGAKRTPAAPLK